MSANVPIETTLNAISLWYEDGHVDWTALSNYSKGFRLPI